MGCPVVHFEISGKDAKKTQEFYSKLFDWKLEAMPGMDYGMVSAEHNGGKGIGGGISGSDQAPPYVSFYVEVDDLQKYLDKAEKMGANTVMPPTTIPGMVSFAMFTDPDGNCVGIVRNERPA